MQICSNLPNNIRAFPVALNPAFPINAPYLNRLHYSRSHPADHLHYHFTWEIGLCMEGSGIFYIGNRVWRYSAGDVSIIAPEVVHIAQSDPEAISGWQFLDIDIDSMVSPFSSMMEGIPGSPYSGIVHAEELPALAPLVLGILEELRLKDPFMEPSVRLKVGELAVSLHRLTETHSAHFPMIPAQLAEIAPAVLFIANHYQEDITLEALASMCRKSVSSFRRDFRNNMNTSPFEYLYHVRVTAAVNLLSTTSLPIQEIAAAVGYQSLSSFNRHFKRIAGKMPKEMRKIRVADRQPVSSGTELIKMDHVLG